MTEPVRVLAKGLAACFDDMTWPTAGEACGDLEYALRHGDDVTRTEAVCAATVLAAYRELVTCPRSKREAVVRRLREAKVIEAKAKGETT